VSLEQLTNVGRENKNKNKNENNMAGGNKNMTI